MFIAWVKGTLDGKGIWEICMVWRFISSYPVCCFVCCMCRQQLACQVYGFAGHGCLLSSAGHYCLPASRLIGLALYFGFFSLRTCCVL